MATANTALRVTELDFDGIKENLKNYLRSQSQFQDFDFEGSGMSVLLDVLAYNTHYMGYYLNMVANESFLDTAQLRQSTISHAKLINYVTSSKHGAIAKINVAVVPSNVESTTNQLTIPKYSKLFGADIDGRNYTFVTLDSNTAVKSGNTFTFNELLIKQGEPVSIQYTMTADNTTRRFEIPSANVDIDTITVVVQESSTNTYAQEYSVAADITEVAATSPVYFVEENVNQNYTIYFGDDVIGKKPKIGNIVNISFLDTVGTPANNISDFSFADPVGGLFSDNITVTTASKSSSGTDKETIEQIRFRAPYFYTTQNRAVTKNDYETLITKDYNNIDSVSVWGGEDNNPPVYGKVFLSLKTTTNYYLSNLEKETIKQELIKNRNVLTVIPEIVDPEYTFLLVSGSVTYNPTLTTNTAEQIGTLIKAAILDYQIKELNRFDSTFRKAKLQAYIEASDKSITGSDIKVYLQKRVLLEPQFTKRYVIDMSFPIKKGDYNNRLYTYPQITVLDSGNVERDVFFEEIPSALTGIDSIEIVNSGVNYTSAPTVTIVGDGAGATAVAKIVSGRITSIEVTNKGSNYTKATVVITGGSGSDAVATPKLEYKFGKLRTYYTKTNGEKEIVNSYAGDIDYENGYITLNSLATEGSITNNFYDTNILTINVPIDKDIIATSRNQIVNIDLDDPRSVQINVVPE